MLGRAAVAMWWDIAADIRPEWEDWHTREHFPERLSIPGFLRGSRWTAADGGEGYFVLYEADSLDVISSGAYLARLNDPTPWSRKMMPHHRNMVRSLCDVRASHGAGLGRFMLTLRCSPESPLPQENLAALPGRKGVVAASLLQADNTKLAARTTEQKIRGGDGTADWVALITAYERGVLERVAAGVKPAAVAGLYVLSHSLVRGEQLAVGLAD